MCFSQSFNFKQHQIIVFFKTIHLEKNEDEIIKEPIGSIAISKANNRLAYYTSNENLRILLKKPPSSDTIWISLSTETSRKPNVLFSHWNEMVGFIRMGKSNMKRAFPRSSEFTSSTKSYDDLYC